MNPYRSFSWLVDVFCTFLDLFCLDKKTTGEEADSPEESYSQDMVVAAFSGSWRDLYFACLDCPHDHPLRKDMVEHLISISDNQVRRSQAWALILPEKESVPSSESGFVEGDPDSWKN